MRLVMLIIPLCFFAIFPAGARPHLSNLDIRVVLSPNGDARITETRQMRIDSEGTECYIVIGNLSGSEVRDLTVTDETGTEYQNIGKWDIDRSRRQKQNRCGIVSKHDGYELCWGLGDSGDRTYITSYTVTRLVKGYDDADGFNYMFVAQGVSPYPDHVRVTITPADTIGFTNTNSRIWAFRYRGDVNFQDSCIVAESSEPFGRESAMIVMAAFDKGMFQPDDVRQGNFEAVKEHAFEGSDYAEKETSLMDKLMIIFFACVWIFIGLLPVVITVYKLWQIWRARRQINRNLLWYRDIPYQGDLLHANGIINAYKYVHASYSNLLSAEILRLIYQGALKIQNVTDSKGKTAQAITIGELTEEGEERDVRLRKHIYKIFKAAAGDDGVLQPKELEKYMQRKASSLQGFSQLLHRSVSFSEAENERKIGPNDRVSQLFGLRKYLKDFTLANERHVEEVGLWKDYLIYATLFGNAEQVLKDMKKINPEYLQMDQIAQVMDQGVVLAPINNAAYNGSLHVSGWSRGSGSSTIRSSGGGGHASWGGGGGFSGGGFGGGVR